MLFPTASLRDPAVSPSSIDSGPAASRLPDAVVFSSAPLRLLAELATAGLRQLATLLPTLEQAVERRDPIPLAYLAKAAGAAARQVGDGHLALLSAGPDRVASALAGASPLHGPAPDGAAPALRSFARQIGATVPDNQALPHESATVLRSLARQLGSVLPAGHAPDNPDPETDPAQRWITEAKHLLHRTGDVLDQAVSGHVAESSGPQATWALLEIAAAQAQIAAAARRLDDVPVPAGRRAVGPRRSTALRLDRLASATGLAGVLLLLAILALAAGLWSITAGLAALVGTVVWVWRIARAARGVRLDARP